MTWTRFEAKARAHAKCVKAGNEAASFWAWAVMWSNDNGTDGYLDGQLLGAIMPKPIANDLAKALADLCVGATIKPGGAGLLELAQGGYIIHDFHQFQPPADEGLKTAWLHEVRSKAGKKGAEARWQSGGKHDSKIDSIPSRARASDRIGSGSDLDLTPEGSAEGAEQTRPNGAGSPGGEAAIDLALRIFGPAWEAKYKRAFVLSTNTGTKGEGAALARAVVHARHVGGGRAEEFFRHYVREFFRDRDKYLEQTTHSPIGLTDVRIRGYGEPKKPKPVAPPKPEPAPEPARVFVPLKPVNGPAPVRKVSTPEELKAKPEADKARLFGNGKP